QLGGVQRPAVDEHRYLVADPAQEPGHRQLSRSTRCRAVRVQVQDGGRGHRPGTEPDQLDLAPSGAVPAGQPGDGRSVADGHPEDVGHGCVLPVAASPIRTIARSTERYPGGTRTDSPNPRPGRADSPNGVLEPGSGRGPDVPSPPGLLRSSRHRRRPLPRSCPRWTCTTSYST